MLEKRRARDMLKMKDTNYFVQVSGYVFSLSQLRHYIICSIRMSVTPMTLCHLSPNLFPKVANNASSVAYSITLILLPRGRRWWWRGRRTWNGWGNAKLQMPHNPDSSRQPRYIVNLPHCILFAILTFSSGEFAGTVSPQMLSEPTAGQLISNTSVLLLGAISPSSYQIALLTISWIRRSKIINAVRPTQRKTVTLTKSWNDWLLMSSPSYYTHKVA